MSRNSLLEAGAKSNCLAKWLSVRLRTKWFWVRVQLQSIHQRCFVTKIVLRNFVKFIEKYLCQSLFFNKVAGPAT